MCRDPMTPDNGAKGMKAALRPLRPVQKGIPAEPGRRGRVLEIIREYVAGRKLVPPLSLEELRDHSSRVLGLAELTAESRDWVAVLVNNEVWRETVAGIPYDRRLLLLPQCLRNLKKLG